MIARVTAAVTFGAAILVGAAAAPALADGGLGGGGGSSTAGGLKVTVSYSGNAAPSGGAGTAVQVPATCWWAPKTLTRYVNGEDTLAGDSDDPEALAKWYKAQTDALTGSFTFAEAMLGDYSMWENAYKRLLAGETISLYTITCRDGADPCAANELAVTEAIPAGTQYSSEECGLPVTYGFYPTDQEPDPYIDPRDLAEAARDSMVIPVPEIDRNPKSAVAGGATLVRLPTWFWVTNPAAVGGTDGERFIRAEVNGGAVWAEVTATTGGLELSSPGGGVTCDPSKALVRYPQGSDSSACTLSFTRASVGYGAGFPVDARTAWAATWVGSGGTGGDLTVAPRGTTVNVPVAESQSLVTGTR